MTLTEAEAQALHAQIDEDAQAAHRQIDEDCRREHEALDRVLARINRGASAQPTPPTPVQVALPAPTTSEPQTGSNGSSVSFPIRRWVREIVAQLSYDVDISQPLVREKMEEMHPELKDYPSKTKLKSQIANALAEMKGKEQLKVVRESFGSHPAIYRRFIKPVMLTGAGGE